MKPVRTEGGRSYEPYLEANPVNTKLQKSSVVAGNSLRYLVEHGFGRTRVAGVMSGRTQSFRDAGWKSPFEEDVKTWEDAENGESRKRAKKRRFGTGMDMVEF
jgi:hypothetical protein